MTAPKSIPFNPNKTSWTVRELLHTKLPEQRWAIPGLLPIGLTFLGGLPKAGKSWLALTIARAVGTGGTVFNRQVERRKVLYLALEDGPHRLKSRSISQKIPEDAKIKFKTSWPLLEDGGQSKIEEFVVKYNYTFIVVDTLSRFCGKDQLKANEMSQYLGLLQKLALENNFSILVNDHNSKGRRGSSILKLYGSIAKSGVADMIYTLDHEEGKTNAVLRGVGRDIGVIGVETIINLEWNSDDCCWQEADAPIKPETFKDKVKRAISELVSEGNLATTTVIAKRLGVAPSTVSVALSDLEKHNEVLKLAKSSRDVPYVLTYMYK